MDVWGFLEPEARLISCHSGGADSSVWDQRFVG
jgi:hypothetical protein